MFATYTHDTPLAAPTQGAAFAKVTGILLTFVALAMVAALTVCVRVFVFEYFHGDQRPLQDLYWLLASLLNL